MYGKWAVPLFVVIALVILLSFAVVFSDPVPDPMDMTPQGITDAFYSEYMRYRLLGCTAPEDLEVGESLADQMYFPRAYLSNACIQRVDDLIGSQGLDYDPFFQEQDIPSGFEVSYGWCMGDEVTVVVHTWHGGLGITDEYWLRVTLQQIDGQWKIDHVRNETNAL